MLHYTAPPVVGGVEGVIEAHARVFLEAGYPVTVVAGQGDAGALPVGTEMVEIPEMNSQHPEIAAMSTALEKGKLPQNFTVLKQNLRRKLNMVLDGFDTVIVHNVFTKHFNLPLTAALWDLLDEGAIANCIAWHHDFTWTSRRSRWKVHEGYPWDLLRTFRSDVINVTVSEERREELRELYQCPREEIRVIYNGVDPKGMYGLGSAGWDLCQRLGLLAADLILLMPVRVTRAKNIEFALEVAAALAASGLRLKLVLTGPPDPHDDKSMAYFRELQARRDELGLSEVMHFVYESGLNSAERYVIDLNVVADLYRLADVLFMPSHQEGFGMPVLEAGLLGLPVAASTAVPAAVEIGGNDIFVFDLDQPAADLAEELALWAEDDARLSLARRTRQRYTWHAIFHNEIEPLLTLQPAE
ncbi:MAG: glycosyltransferase family 4 protein [Candidatus Promineifilaceae bacterium]